MLCRDAGRVLSSGSATDSTSTTSTQAILSTKTYSRSWANCEATAMTPLTNTFGWSRCIEVRGLCATCDRVVHEARMCACDLNRKEFPTAPECTNYKAEDDDDRIWQD